MREAKIPKINTNWRSIDIYLFSNGQQYSPPRKYHLHSDELARWKPTLMHLARLHYGSLHSSIELYALDGNKVNGPLELVNGNAYVAVEPPDLFIDSGYSKYMIKASRSWEKSRARKMISNEIIKSDESNNEIMKSDKVTNDMSMKTAYRNETPDMMKVYDDENIDTVTIPFASKVNDSLKSFTPLLKATENKNQPHSQYPTVITKLPSSATLAPKTRFLANKKNQVPKTNPKLQNLQRKVSNENKVPVTKKVTSMSYKFKTPFSISSKIKKVSNDSSNRPSRLEPIKKPINNNSTTNDVQPETSIFKNTNSELSSIVLSLEDDSHKRKIDEKQLHNDMNETYDIVIPIPQQIVDAVKNNLPNDSKTTYTNNCKTNSKIFIDSMQHEPNATLSKAKLDENCMVINKGDIINFKLHIEIQKQGSDTETSKKDDKASQINFHDEIFVKNKIPNTTLHSLLVSELNQFIEDNKCCKLVIMKNDCCAYCRYDSSNLDTLLPPNVNRKCFVLGPNAKFSEQIQRYQCEYEDKEDVKTMDENNENAKSTSIYNYLKRTITDFSLERLSGTEPEIIVIIKDQETPKAGNKSNDSDNKGSEQNECIITKLSENQTDDENLETFDNSKTNDKNSKSKCIIKRNLSETEDYENAKLIITGNVDEASPKTILENLAKFDKSKTDDENLKSKHIIKRNLLENEDYENAELIITGNADEASPKTVLENLTKFDKSKTDDENLKSEYIIKRNLLETEDYENAKLIITGNADEVSPKTVLDKSIQTENSNILLQVRRQDDGHYTFHLPPLYLLKYYKIF